MDELKELELTSENENTSELNKLEGIKEPENLTIKNGLFDESPVVDYDTLFAALDGLLLVHNKPITYEKINQLQNCGADSSPCN